MSNRDSKRFALLIDPKETALQPVPESPTVAATMEHQTTQQAPPQSASSGAAQSGGYRQRSQSQSQNQNPGQKEPQSFSRPRKSSMRRQPPTGLTMESNKLGVPRKIGGDFPSPGSAPKGQRIFDASSFAEKKGVETAQPGWAVDSRTQNKLEDQHWKEEHPEEVENMGQKISRSLSTVKRSASMSVKRAKSLRRPRGNSSAHDALIEPDMPPPPAFEDEDAKMVRLSVVKPGNNDKW